MNKENIERDNKHERALKSILRRDGKWDCLYPGCIQKSIFSHAISKSISLATIAENGHLTTVESRRNGNEKKLQFGSISVQDATAFNGFCETHDALFASLDNEEITSAKSLLLQVYRSVISECVNESRLSKLSTAGFMSLDIEKTIEQADTVEYPFLLEDEGKELFKSMFAKMVAAESQRSAELMILPNQILERLDIPGGNSLEGGSVFTTEQLSHYIPYRKLSFQMPVAVNCIIPTVIGGENRDFYFVVIPYEKSTLIVGVVPKSSDQTLLDTLMQSFSSDAAAIDLVESLIVSSNEWYMTPSVLEEIPYNKREVFLQDSTFGDAHRFYERYEMTIFDNLRKALAQQKPELKPELRLEDSDVIPQRESFDVRHQRMIAAICAQPFKYLKD
ncbi:hypothetical protein [Pseudomonas kilonensis]